MPDNTYYYRFDELKFEFIGMDTSSTHCPHAIGGDGRSSYFNQCGGERAACTFLGHIFDAGKDLLKERSAHSTAESIFVA